MLVINDISQPGSGFESAQNEVTIVTASGEERHIPRTTKQEIARAVLDAVERLKNTTEGSSGTDRADPRSALRV